MLLEVLTLKTQMVSQQVDLPSCSIFYQQGGVQLGQTPIVFLHGWGISAKPYHEILKHHYDFRVRYRFLSQEEGGRRNPPFQGYRSDFEYAQKAIKAMKQLTQSVNENKRKADSMHKILNFQSRIKGKKVI